MNELLPVKGAMALSRIMSNCIQHNWSTDLIGKLTGSLYELTHKVPVAAYWFVPDSSAVKYILSHE
jgi:alcohol dehydrogenase YqhD (iron-dependent ADH family)